MIDTSVKKGRSRRMIFLLFGMLFLGFLFGTAELSTGDLWLFNGFVIQQNDSVSTTVVVNGTFNATTLLENGTSLCKSTGVDCPSFGSGSGWVNDSSGNVALINSGGNVAAGTLQVDNVNGKVNIGSGGSNALLDVEQPGASLPFFAGIPVMAVVGGDGIGLFGSPLYLKAGSASNRGSGGDTTILGGDGHNYGGSVIINGGSKTFGFGGAGGDVQIEGGGGPTAFGNVLLAADGTGGKVGIGTYVPSSVLTVVGDTNITGQVIVGNTICNNSVTSKLLTSDNGTLLCGTDQGGSGNASWNQTLADHLYTNSSIALSLGNWSADKNGLPNLSYSQITTANGNWSLDKVNLYANMTGFQLNFTSINTTVTALQSNLTNTQLNISALNNTLVGWKGNVTANLTGMQLNFTSINVTVSSLVNLTHANIVTAEGNWSLDKTNLYSNMTGFQLNFTSINTTVTTIQSNMTNFQLNFTSINTTLGTVIGNKSGTGTVTCGDGTAMQNYTTTAGTPSVQCVTTGGVTHAQVVAAEGNWSLDKTNLYSNMTGFQLNFTSINVTVSSLVNLTHAAIVTAEGNWSLDDGNVYLNFTSMNTNITALNVTLVGWKGNVSANLTGLQSNITSINSTSLKNGSSVNLTNVIVTGYSNYTATGNVTYYAASSCYTVSNSTGLYFIC